MKLIHTSLAMILCIVMSASLAAILPSHYPDEFDYVGVIKELDLRSNTIVIDGLRHTLSSNFIVHSLARNFDSNNSLRTGMRIGYGFLSIERNNRQIGEIWILPSHYELPEGG